MDELKRILALPKEDRTASDLDYLESHKDELTEDQLNQLQEEAEPLNPLTKKIGQKVHTQMDAVIKENGDGSLRAIVNSGKEDRHGEVLDIKGLDIKEYMKNPILAYSHDYSHPSVGKTIKLTKKESGQLEADFKFATDIDGYEIPKILDQLYRKGYQFAFSIGFIPQEIEGNRYTKSTMIEFSPVLVPADANALLQKKEFGKLGIDTKFLNAYNIKDMNLEAILLKVKEQGIESLTLAEVKFLKENRDDLTANQIKELSSVIEDPKPEPVGDTKPADETAKALKEVQDNLKTISESISEIKKIEVKDINGQHSNKGFNHNKGEVSKELKFLFYARGLQSGNYSQYLNVVGKDAMNTSDDSVVTPPVEFILEVERLEEQVGVAQRFANVRRMNSGAGFKYVMGDDDLEIFDTAESGVKKSTKLTYKQLLLGWRKFAGILPITDELTEDSALDLWADATSRFARAYAKREDQLVFTETAAGGNTKNGILHVAGTNVVNMTSGSGSFNDLTADVFYQMVYAVPSMSAANGRFYLNRQILGIAALLKDDNNRPLWQASIAEGIPPTIAGKPYTEVEVMPGTDDDDVSTGFVVFGDLKYATLGIRRDLNIKMFDSGSVGDPDDEDQSDQINLLTQDVQAMRAVKRMNAVVRFPEAFSVLKTNSQS